MYRLTDYSLITLMDYPFVSSNVFVSVFNANRPNFMDAADVYALRGRIASKIADSRYGKAMPEDATIDETVTDFRDAMTSWLYTKRPLFERIDGIYKLEYGVLDNTDKHVEVTDTTTRVDENSASTEATTSGTDNSTDSGTNTSQNKALSMPVDTAQEEHMILTGKNLADGSSSGTHTGNSTSESASTSTGTGTSTITSTHTEHAHGNIGVTMSTQLIEAEVALREKAVMLEYIAADFIAEFECPYYG